MTEPPTADPPNRCLPSPEMEAAQPPSPSDNTRSKDRIHDGKSYDAKTDMKCSHDFHLPISDRLTMSGSGDIVEYSQTDTLDSFQMLGNVVPSLFCCGTDTSEDTGFDSSFSRDPVDPGGLGNKGNLISQESDTVEGCQNIDTNTWLIPNVTVPEVPDTFHVCDLAQSNISGGNLDASGVMHGVKIAVTKSPQAMHEGDSGAGSLVQFDFNTCGSLQAEMESAMDNHAVDITNIYTCGGNFDTRLSSQDFQKPETESEPLNWALLETSQSHASLALSNSADVSLLTDGVNLQPENLQTSCSASDELWVDACQFLADEVDEAPILNEWGYSPTPSSSDESTQNTKVSGVLLRMAAPIGQLSSDTVLWGPPVERWSSTDSWASALSDWAPAQTLHPEDFPQAGTSSEASMAIQDQAVEQRQALDSSILSGQTCPLPNMTEVAPTGPKEQEMQKKGNFCFSVQNDLENKTVISAHGAPFCSSDCPGAIPHGKDSNIEEVRHKDIYSLKDSAEDQIFFSDAGQSQQESTDLWEVTEDTVSLPILHIEEEGDKSYDSVDISSYSGWRVSAPRCAEEHAADRRSLIAGLNLTPHSTQLHNETRPLTASAHGTHAGKVESYLEHGGAQAEYTCLTQQEVKNDAPQFILPLAPLSPVCLGNNLLRHANSPLTVDKVSAAGSKNEHKLKTWVPTHGYTIPGLDIAPKIHLKPAAPGISSSEEHDDQQPSASSEDDQGPKVNGNSSENTDQDSSSTRDSETPADLKQSTTACSADDLSEELSKLLMLTGEHFMVSEKERIAFVTLDLDNSIKFMEHQRGPFPVPLKSTKGEKIQLSCVKERTKATKMTHKTSNKESTSHSKSKDKAEMASLAKDAVCDDGSVTLIETVVITEKITAKAHHKKKKKHSHSAVVKTDQPTIETGAKHKMSRGKTECSEAKLPAKDDPKSPKKPSVQSEIRPKVAGLKKDVKVNRICGASAENTARVQEDHPTRPEAKQEKQADLIKRRCLSEDKFGGTLKESKQHMPEVTVKAKKDEEATCRKAYNEVVKQKSHKVIEVPRVVGPIQAEPVPNDPQSISLWCQFSLVTAASTVTWTKGQTILAEVTKNTGDDGRMSLAILKVCSKDLGMYHCCLRNPHGSASSDFHLTSEVLCELVIPSHDTVDESSDVAGEEESIQCAPLLFKDDFLCEQYFGEHQAARIVTEKVHFGEGMHRRAFRTTLRDGMKSNFHPGHPCVLKVHNAISYGTKTNEELVQKNYNLAVEECYVQNTAREYIKAYNSVAKSAENFGEVPEIIPIFLVHRPSNDIPYATLEEELRGDFVKYSVKDGKEINLMRRDSEAGQKCCAFQHWVYTTTEGNLLVTDMQGVGMRLTDVGIATCKKGYKGFKGNCATSFIDQFKALHQCNKYCELLGLISLQPKPKHTGFGPKPKPHTVPKKKTFAQTLKGKS
ncbi:alpha-protein kinase 2 isoform X2 [Denticeps clupeoides]|uniref:alpha-protein kinase 2 isoform X2 n=1 Tax=Denticeps clupeoides TaxID=299321 RepID=UPI0010A37B8D|nr:alpha-protein kinase 2 isoform X2 [Denticeps clupeoides]